MDRPCKRRRKKKHVSHPHFGKTSWKKKKKPQKILENSSKYWEPYLVYLAYKLICKIRRPLEWSWNAPEILLFVFSVSTSEKCFKQVLDESLQSKKNLQNKEPRPVGNKKHVNFFRRSLMRRYRVLSTCLCIFLWVGQTGLDQLSLNKPIFISAYLWWRLINIRKWKYTFIIMDTLENIGISKMSIYHWHWKKKKKRRKESKKIDEISL